VTGTAQVIRANARNLPLADNSVDLVVTSPPYFALRSYQDGGEHYPGQIGDEPTPAEFVDSLLEVTRECVRVLKPSGSLWVNLGDKYAGSNGQAGGGGRSTLGGGAANARARVRKQEPLNSRGVVASGAPPKSLIGVPWRYALACIDDLGLILRAEVIWSKPNGLPESVTDRVRRSHEFWFHFSLNPRYFSAVDEIREEHLHPSAIAYNLRNGGPTTGSEHNADRGDAGVSNLGCNPLGKLPGSVWTVPTEPLVVPDHLGVDHFAAFPTEWPRRIIQGWSPGGVCVECGEGRRPVVSKELIPDHEMPNVRDYKRAANGETTGGVGWTTVGSTAATITGYACACPEPTAPTTPSVILDPFGGTGTTAMVAKALGRHGISVDMSADYCRLAEWRTNDPKQLAKAARKPYTPSEKPMDGQGDLLDLLDGEAS
jgi:DNA modification methylase